MGIAFLGKSSTRFAYLMLQAEQFYVFHALAVSNYAIIIDWRCSLLKCIEFLEGNLPFQNERFDTIFVDPADFQNKQQQYFRIKVAILDLRDYNYREKNSPTLRKSKPVLRLRRQHKENPEPVL